MRAFWPAAYLGVRATAQSAEADDAKRRENAQKSNLGSGTACKAALRPNQAAGLPERQETTSQRRPILFQLAQYDHFPPISLLLVFSPCGLTTMMPAQRLRS